MHTFFDGEQEDNKGLQTTHVTILRQIERTVEMWRKEKTSEEYYLATKRMSCLHCLIQVQDEVNKALEIHKDHATLVRLKDIIETLQVTVT